MWLVQLDRDASYWIAILEHHQFEARSRAQSGEICRRFVRNESSEGLISERVIWRVREWKKKRDLLANWVHIQRSALEVPKGRDIEVHDQWSISKKFETLNEELWIKASDRELSMTWSDEKTNIVVFRIFRILNCLQNWIQLPSRLVAGHYRALPVVGLLL